MNKKLIRKYKVRAAEIILSIRYGTEGSIPNVEYAVGVANKFMVSLRYTELMKHVAEINGIPMDKEIQERVYNLFETAGLLDTDHKPTDRAEMLGVFSDRKSRSKAKFSSGLIITPLGMLVYLVEAHEVQQKVMSLMEQGNLGGLHI